MKKNATKNPKVSFRCRLNEKVKQINFNALGRTFRRLFRVLVKIFVGAVLFAFIAELAPELREKLPNFYEIVDLLLQALEFVALKALKFIQFYMSIF